MTKPEMLLKIRQAGFPENEVAIPLDDFFSGENCSDAMGANIYPDPPPIGQFYAVFKDLLDAGVLQKAWVRISDTEEPGNWFYGDTVYVLTDIEMDELHAHLATLHPDEISEGYMYAKPDGLPDPQEGEHIYSIWWD